MVTHMVLNNRLIYLYEVAPLSLLEQEIRGKGHKGESTPWPRTVKPPGRQWRICVFLPVERDEPLEKASSSTRLQS